LKLIEVDGGSHIGKEKEDRIRDEILQSLNLRVIRVSDVDVKTNIGEVLERIEDFIFS